MKHRALLEGARQRARQRHLEAIENPGDPEREYDAGVKAAPAQRIETEGNAGFDDVAVAGLVMTGDVAGFARSVQIALPSLQTHGALPIGNCGEAKGPFNGRAQKDHWLDCQRPSRRPGSMFAPRNRMGFLPKERRSRC